VKTKESLIFSSNTAKYSFIHSIIIIIRYC